jgi:hypothetical protein
MAWRNGRDLSTRCSLGIETTNNRCQQLVLFDYGQFPAQARTHALLPSGLQ